LFKTYAKPKKPHKLKDVLVWHLNGFEMQLPNCLKPKPITKFCCVLPNNNHKRQHFGC